MQVIHHNFEPLLTSTTLKPELSLVMPAFNEEDNIEEVIAMANRVLKKTGLRYELIVVDDGSVDNTLRKAVNYANNDFDGYVSVISYDRNIGKGYAMRTGFTHARGDIVVFVDSDSNINPSQLIRYINALKHGDIVIASKWHPQSKVEIPLLRKILSHGFNGLVRLLTGIKLSDTQSGLKAVWREAFENVFLRLSVKRYAIDVELLVVANLYGLKVVELPVSLKLECGLFSLREIWRMFLDLLGITYRLRVVKWYQRSLKEMDT